MKGFPGFPDGKVRLTQVPNLFFSDLLPIIDNMAELKVTLYAFWALGQKEGKVRYLRLTDFLNDPAFIKGLGPTTEMAAEAMVDGVERAVARGTFLHVNVESADGKMDLYFMNTEKGRAAVEGITKGEWRPNPDEDEPITLLVERPNVFILYEQNIGPLTPMVADELRVSGGRVVITGTVNGNVELRADEIIIEETAVISGNLLYKSSHEASIADGARIDGEVRHTPIEFDMKPVVASVIIAGLVLLFSIILTAVILYLLFPDYCLRVSQALHDQPWQSLAIGLAVFAGVPLLVVILFSTAVGVWLALMLLVVYLVMLLVGYFAGALYVGNAGLNMFGKTEVSKTLRAIALAVAIFSETSCRAVIRSVPG